MSCHCTLIEGRAGTVRPVLERLLGRGLGWRLERVGWDSLRVSQLGVSGSDLLIADSTQPETAILEFFRSLENRPLGLPCIAVLSRQPDSSLLSLVSCVTDDFLLWPASDQEVRERIGRLRLEVRAEEASRALAPELGRLRLVGRSPAFLRVIEMLPRAAEADFPVLVSGETGSGKELVARAIHFLGKRHGGPFVPVDCGAIPQSLFENEVFGHSRGAYTGADRDQKGLVEIADGGILFLDEVDSLPLEAQAKLLRFLEDRTFRRLGQPRSREVDINVLAATNVDLRRKVERGEFRSDLYFRLNVLNLHLPPLRSRIDDIEPLARHRLDALDLPRARGMRISRSALLELRYYPWPGNVRELFNVVQRAAILCRGRTIRAKHIVFDAPQHQDPAAAPPVATFNEARARVLARFEKDFVTDLLRKHHGNITRAARAAGKERRAFGRLVKKHRIDPQQI